MPVSRVEQPRNALRARVPLSLAPKGRHWAFPVTLNEEDGPHSHQARWLHSCRSCRSLRQSARQNIESPNDNVCAQWPGSRRRQLTIFSFVSTIRSRGFLPKGQRSKPSPRSDSGRVVSGGTGGVESSCILPVTSRRQDCQTIRLLSSRRVRMDVQAVCMGTLLRQRDRLAWMDCMSARQKRVLPNDATYGHAPGSTGTQNTSDSFSFTKVSRHCFPVGQLSDATPLLGADDGPLGDEIGKSGIREFIADLGQGQTVHLLNASRKNTNGQTQPTRGEPARRQARRLAGSQTPTGRRQTHSACELRNAATGFCGSPRVASCPFLPMARICQCHL